MRPLVVVTDHIEPDLEWESAELSRRGVDFEHHQLKFAAEEDLARATERADIVVVNMVRITSSLIRRWRNCHLVIRHGVGYDNVDVQALSARCIPLVYVPDYCLDEVAEQAIAVILALGRKIGASQAVLREWSRLRCYDLSPVKPIHRMTGSSLGIIGLGRIGSRVLGKVSGFAFQTLICDPYLSEERKRAFGIEVQPLERVLRESDYVTIHTPLNAETRHLINRDTLTLMKTSAFLVNTARAELVDIDALYEALVEGRLAGAGLDVFRPEPPDLNHPLFGLRNVILTPHMAWYSEEAQWVIRQRIVEEIDRHLLGLPPLHSVNGVSTSI